MNKRIDLDKLEAELEKWSGEIPLPCEAVVAMVDELRYWRERAAKEADQPAATETAGAPFFDLQVLERASRPRELCAACLARLAQAMAEGKLGIVVCGECALKAETAPQGAPACEPCLCCSDTLEAPSGNPCPLCLPGQAC